VRGTLATLSIGVLVVAAACGGHGSTSGSGTLETIASVQQFARDFDAGAGHARLVLVLSPT
jgi:hypothetical protein